MKTEVDAMAMIIPAFGRAGVAQAGGQVDDAGIDRVFAKWVEPAGSGSEPLATRFHRSA